MTETAADIEPLLLRWDRTERFKHREIIGGLLAMHSYRAGHGGTLHALRSQLDKQLPEDLTCASRVLVPFELEVHEYCPDVMVVPREEAARDGEVCRPEWVSLVFEVISPEARHFDYGIKAQVYARAGIAEYVIFDPYTREATRLARPGRGKYTLREVVEYGKPVRIEEPFSIVIETAGLPVDPKG